MWTPARSLRQETASLTPELETYESGPRGRGRPRHTNGPSAFGTLDPGRFFLLVLLTLFLVFLLALLLLWGWRTLRAVRGIGTRRRRVVGAVRLRRTIRLRSFWLWALWLWSLRLRTLWLSRPIGFRPLRLRLLGLPPVRLGRLRGR